MADKGLFPQFDRGARPTDTPEYAEWLLDGLRALTREIQTILAKCYMGGVLSIGGGTAIKKYLSASATLNFGAPGAVPGSVDLTITVTGAELGDVVLVGAPVTVGANYVLTGFVSAANTVTVRWTQIAGAAANPDGGGGIYRASVLKH